MGSNGKVASIGSSDSSSSSSGSGSTSAAAAAEAPAIDAPRHGGGGDGSGSGSSSNGATRRRPLPSDAKLRQALETVQVQAVGTVALPHCRSRVRAHVRHLPLRHACPY